MRTQEIIEFVRRHIEPLPHDEMHGEVYRAAGILKDGTVLPCVAITGATWRVDLAIKRFEETRKPIPGHVGYRQVVQAFVAAGNRVNGYDLSSLSPSPHAIPRPRMREIDGETSMGWTEFYAVMRDGAEFRFGTTFLTEFFEMPQGYVATDIARIIPAVRGEPPRQERIYRDRPFFTCYVEGL